MLYDRAAAAGLPMSLGALGLSIEQARAAAETIAASSYTNVWLPDRDRLTELLERAQRGDRPSAPSAPERFP